ncbi:unnamed protein product [Caenorhabditis sp. 36 PRJEB53466]|nr:unnamed protein product [Caenorhabditis sp. 36 PRJEB53466]
MLLLRALLLLAIPLLASARLEAHQEFVSSSRVSFLYEIDTEPSTERAPTQVHKLFPYHPLVKVIFLDSFTPVFNFTIQLIDSYSRESISDRIQRHVPLVANEPWFNDTFTTVSGVSFSVSTRFSCAPNYFGPQCDQFCDGHMAKAARKRCDAQGRLRCDVGWMGPHCGQVVDPRRCNCHNDGACVSSLIHNPINSTMLEEHLICECSNGFTGEKCEIPGFSQFQFTAPKSDACTAKDACLNGAQCFPNGPKVFCACPVRFIGEFCEVRLTTQPSPIGTPVVTASGYSLGVYIIAAFFVVLLLLVACFTYKYKPRRDDALSRGQDPSPYAVPETKSMLVNPEKRMDRVYTIEEEDRYTMAPKKSMVSVGSEYATIQKKPSPPSMLPPPVPSSVSLSFYV